MTQATETITSETIRTGRVRTEPNQRRVRVFFGGEAVADSSRTLYLFETEHLPVYYFPRDDVRFDLLEPTSHRTRAGGVVHEDIVWGYPAPIPETPKIENLLAFYNEKVDIVVDGVPQERPVTKWS